MALALGPLDETFEDLFLPCCALRVPKGLVRQQKKVMSTFLVNLKHMDAILGPYQDHN